MRKCCSGLLLVGMSLALLLHDAEGGKKKPRVAFTDPLKAGPDFVLQGEYVRKGKDPSVKWAAQVIARGDGEFVVNLLRGGLPGAGWDGKTKHTGDAKTVDNKTTVTGKGWSGEITAGQL